MRLLAVALVLVLVSGATALAQHPHLYFGEAELAALRARAADATDRGGFTYAEIYEGYAAQAETKLATPIVFEVAVPDADGSGSVMWRYALSRTPPGPHRNNASYPTWTALSRVIQGHLELLSFVYAIDRDDRWLRTAEGTGAIDVALAVSAWPTWNDPEYACHPACLDTAHLTFGVALLYDVAYDALTEAERTAIRSALIRRGIFPLSEATLVEAPPHNVSAVRATALAVGAAAVHTESVATPHFEKAHAALTFFVEAQGDDGGPLEGNLYGAYALDTIVRSAIALERKTELPPLLDHPWIEGLPRFTAAFLGTDGTSANFGDASLARYWSTTMFGLASRGNEGAQWYLDEVFDRRPNSWLALALVRDDVVATAPIERPGGALYPDTGYAALRSGFDGAPMLALKSGPTSEVVGHNHFDHNSFIVSAFGHWLAADPGYRSYFHPATRNFTTGTVGHNSMLVDGSVSADGAAVRGGQSALAGGVVRHLWQGAAYSRVIGEAAATYPDGVLDRFTRRIYYARPHLFFVLDEVSAPRAHEYSFLLHTFAEAAVERREGDGALASVRAMGDRGALHSFGVSSVGFLDGAPALRTFPNVTERAPYAEWRTRSSARSTSVLALVPVAADAESPRAFPLGDPPAGLVVEASHGVDLALSFLGDPRIAEETVLAAPSGPVREVRTDAVLALVGLDGEGALSRAYLQEGTSLSIDGVELVRSERAGGYDLRVEREGDCTRLVVEEVETLEGSPFTVRADADEVSLGGARVAFAREGETVRFPVEGEPQTCRAPDPDAGTTDASPPADAGSAPETTATGCGCRASASPGSAALASLIVLCSLTRVRGSRRARPR